MSSKARQLKKIFSDRWRYGVRRELLVLNIVNMFLPEGYIALLTGIGSGAGEYVDESYSNPINAFDITVFDRDYKPVAFLEITGVERIADMDKKKGLCIGGWKVWKAEKFHVEDKTFYIHVLTSKQSIRVISYYMLKKHGQLKTLYEGYGWRGQFYCCDSKYWGSLEILLRFLQVRR